jgi:6-pyruvoyltetrahydropterin/6-carboxytetrahydropterin synthase
LTRVEKFSAAHRLWSPTLSDAENLSTFGPCTRTHGHNYVLSVSVAGRIDPATGMVINLTTIKALVTDRVVAVLDHHHIDEDVPWFGAAGRPSTAENIALWAFLSLRGALPAGVDVVAVRLDETDKNTAVIRAEDVPAQASLDEPYAA